jgi:putative glutamine amidotransferase
MAKQNRTMDLRVTVGVCLPNKGNRFAYWFIKFNLWLQNAKSVPLRPSTLLPNINSIDALILSGGADINPSLYGADKKAHNTELDKPRDDFELTMIETAYKKKLPILGICRGAQLINIYFKGTLHATILELDEFIIHKNSIFPIKQVLIKRFSNLFKIIKQKKIIANSIHNQAINKVGNNLKISACHEKIIEAIEKENYPFLLGVQWHPEYLIYLKEHREIFKQLCIAAQKYKKNKMFSDDTL